MRWEGEPTRVAPLGLTDDVRRAWLDSRRRHLLSSVQRGRAFPSRARSRRRFQHLSALTASVLGEVRTPDEYRAEVDRYMSWSEEHFDELIVDRFARCGRNTVGLVVENDSGCNLPDVELTLYIPGAVAALEPRRHPGVRARPTPRPFGTARQFFPPSMGSVMPIATGLDLGDRRISIINGGSATVRIDLGDGRPMATVSAPLFVVLANEPPGSALQCTWRVTSTGVDAIPDGERDIEVAEEPVDPAAILPPTEDVED